MREMLSLIKRDWKLYKHSLWLPGIFCVLWAFLPFIMIFSTDPSKAGDLQMLTLIAYFASGLMASLRVLGFILIEESYGTLGDYLALPISRFKLVNVRIFEFVILTVFFILVSVVEGVIMLSMTGHLKLLIPSKLGTYLLGMGWIWTLSFIIPLPFVLKWGKRGFLYFASAFLICLMALSMGWFKNLTFIFHPQPIWVNNLQLSFLLALGYLGSLKAYESREV